MSLNDFPPLDSTADRADQPARLYWFFMGEDDVHNLLYVSSTLEGVLRMLSEELALVVESADRGEMKLDGTYPFYFQGIRRVVRGDDLREIREYAENAHICFVDGDEVGREEIYALIGRYE